jgi:hypothetical protein
LPCLREQWRVRGKPHVCVAPRAAASRRHTSRASRLPPIQEHLQRTWKTSLPLKWRDSLSRWASAASERR